MGLRRPVLLLAAFAAIPGVLHAQETSVPREGQSLAVGDRRLSVRKVEILPYIESDYTRRFAFDTFENAKLKDLRTRYELDRVIEPGKDEFEKQLLLLDWVHNRFRKFGRPTSKARDALGILKANDEGHTFFCSHFGSVFVSAAASVGWVDRSLALKRPDHLGKGATEHTSTEIWSNQFRKWVMVDPTFSLYVEKNGIPLNAYELRQEWFLREGRDLVFVVGKERKRHKAGDLPIFLKRFAGYGDLAYSPSSLHKYAFIGYIPNTDFLTRGPDYGKMFIVQDEIGKGTSWHRRTVPKDPAREPYFPINQVEIRLGVGDGRLKGTFRTMTPNFKTYQVRFGGGEWTDCGSAVEWKLRPGQNLLEARTINRFGIPGAVSTVALE